jgi:hypothetical protein
VILSVLEVFVIEGEREYLEAVRVDRLPWIIAFGAKEYRVRWRLACS